MSRGRGVGGSWGRRGGGNSRRRITIGEILTWADEHRRLDGRWPDPKSKPHGLPPGVTWRVVQSSLSKGLRGLPGGSSLVQLLAEHRNYRGKLTIERILAWVDAHHEATGEWPTRMSGLVIGTDDETWVSIDIALLQGRRGLEDEAGLTLARLLAMSRQVRNAHTLPRMTVDQVLEWADAYHAKSGRWPRANSGPVDEMPGETWNVVETALYQGLRGLPGGTTLPQLLSEHRGARVIQTSRPLGVDQILAWADAHRAATGKWPVEDSGPVTEAPEETWVKISMALTRGSRELPGGSSLAKLLAERRGKRNMQALPPLDPERILAWAEAYWAAHGRCPTTKSGSIPEAPTPGETWATVGSALVFGHRGLPGGSSLARLLETPLALARARGRGEPVSVPMLVPDGSSPRDQADDDLEGMEPSPSTAGRPYFEGPQAEVEAMSRGRGVGRPWSRRSGRPTKQRFTIPMILGWADEHRRLTGQWPRTLSSPEGLPLGLTWLAVRTALDSGLHGLHGGSSLSRLLAEQRGYRWQPEPLTVAQILAWADAHRAATGKWPTIRAGKVLGVEDELWASLNSALYLGIRGLPGGSSLARMLEEHRQVRNLKALPAFTIDQILAWADAHRARTGTWPRLTSGPIPEMPGQTWAGVEKALISGRRGLPGGTTIPQLIAEHRGARRIQTSRPLGVDQILAWADAHRAATGKWPVEDSGPVTEAPGEKWGAIGGALVAGSRGLPGGSSLARLLAEHRGRRNHRALPPLDLDQVRAWAESHRAAHGRWPVAKSGPVADPTASGETWAGINASLRRGRRGLPGGSSLSLFLAMPLAVARR